MSLASEEVTTSSVIRFPLSVSAGRTQRAGPVSALDELTAEIPGLDRVLHVVRYRPSLSRVLRELDHLDTELVADGADQNLRTLELHLRCAMELLLSIDEELWRPAENGLPWKVMQWTMRAASSIAIVQHVLAYVSRNLPDNRADTLAALRTGARYAHEAALAFCRFDLEALRWDEERATELERSLGWGG